MLFTSLLPQKTPLGNPRNKVALRKGFSLMDWIRLSNSGKDLAGMGGKIKQVCPKRTLEFPQNSYLILPGYQEGALQAQQEGRLLDGHQRYFKFKFII